MPETEYAGLTPNQVVAYNLFLARTLRGWTQDEAAEKLAPHIGKRWSKASWSAAERSATGDRIREFDLDEIYAFSLCFDLPITYFLLPPPLEVHGRGPVIRAPGHPEREQAGETAGEWIDRIFAVDDASLERLRELFAKVIPLEARTPGQRTMSDRLTRYIASTMAEEITELGEWQASLLTLARKLGQVHKASLGKVAADVAAAGGMPAPEEHTDEPEGKSK